MSTPEYNQNTQYYKDTKKTNSSIDKWARDLNNHVTKYFTWPIHMKRCSTSSVRNKEINSTMCY